MTWEHEVVVLEKNVGDLQKQLNEAYKRIAELSAQNINKDLALKSVRNIVEEELKYKNPMYDQDPLKSIKELVEQELVGP